MQIRNVLAPCLAGLVSAVAFAGPSPRSELASAPLTTPDGAPFIVPTADVLVVSVWSSTCAACAGELKNLQALADAFAKDPEVAFLVVNVDAYIGTPKDVREKAQAKLSLRMPLAVDAQARFIRTVEAWAASGPSASPKLPTTVTMPAVYVIDAAGRTRAETKQYRDTKPREFVEKYRPLVERAKKGELEAGGSGSSVSTTIAQDYQDVAISRGKVKLKFPQMTDAQIARTLPDVRKQLAQMFPKAQDAELDKMLLRVQEGMKKGEPVEFDSQ